MSDKTGSGEESLQPSHPIIHDIIPARQPEQSRQAPLIMQAHNRPQVPCSVLYMGIFKNVNHTASSNLDKQRSTTKLTELASVGVV